VRAYPDIANVKGFLDPAEAGALYELALELAPRGPIVEIGSYCGKSALCLGTAAREAGGVLVTIDHHRGSEENQPGWAYHDPELWDEEAGALDTLPALRRTLREAGLEENVIAIVGRSHSVAELWRAPIALLFIDGGHTREAALADYRLWAPKIMPGGVLAIHDVFPDPADGGRPPFEIFELACGSGLFAQMLAVKSLRALTRLGA
jgi:predicted O-methyltransferase YrrM